MKLRQPSAVKSDLSRDQQLHHQLWTQCPVLHLQLLITRSSPPQTEQLIMVVRRWASPPPPQQPSNRTQHTQQCWLPRALPPQPQRWSPQRNQAENRTPFYPCCQLLGGWSHLHTSLSAKQQWWWRVLMGKVCVVLTEIWVQRWTECQALVLWVKAVYNGNISIMRPPKLLLHCTA